MHKASRWRTRGVALLATVVALGAACGSSDPAEPAAPTTETPATSAPGTTARADASGYCDAIDSFMDTVRTSGFADLEDDDAFDQFLDALLDLSQWAPEEVANEFDTLTDFYIELRAEPAGQRLDGVDGSVEDELDAAYEAIEAYTVETCGVSLAATEDDYCAVVTGRAAALTDSTALEDLDALERFNKALGSLLAVAPTEIGDDLEAAYEAIEDVTNLPSDRAVDALAVLAQDEAFLDHLDAIDAYNAENCELDGGGGSGGSGGGSVSGAAGIDELKAHLQTYADGDDWVAAYNGWSIATIVDELEVYLNTGAAPPEAEMVAVCEATLTWIEDVASGGTVTISVRDVPVVTGATDSACEPV